MATSLKTKNYKLVTLPGLIDCHVHFREPGLEHKETMATGAAAAMVGGVMTVCEMPNTKPATTSIEALKDKVRRANGIHSISNGVTGSRRFKSAATERNYDRRIHSPFDIRFFFGATEHEHLEKLRELFINESLKNLRARCCGLKLYFDHSTGDQKADHDVIEAAFKLCVDLNIPLVGHCENAEINQKDPSRPPESEIKAIEDALSLAKKYGTQFHVAHLSTKQGLDLVRKAKFDGLMVSCEVAPHHLFLTVEDFKKLGPLAKMNPPLRMKDHQDALWEGIEDGTIDCIATDHAPHTLEEKQSLNPPAGIPGVETMLPLLLTGTTTYNLQPHDIARLCFTNPNKIFRLGKKSPEEGGPSITVDLDAEWTIRGKELHSKCGWTPFEGWVVRGKIVD